MPALAVIAERLQQVSGPSERPPEFSIHASLCVDRSARAAHAKEKSSPPCGRLPALGELVTGPVSASA
jgi:hypothetical protein